MDDLVKEALPILRVIETKVYVEQGRQELKTGSLFLLIRNTCSCRVEQTSLRLGDISTPALYVYPACLLALCCTYSLGFHETV